MTKRSARGSGVEEAIDMAAITREELRQQMGLTEDFVFVNVVFCCFDPEVYAG